MNAILMLAFGLGSILDFIMAIFGFVAILQIKNDAGYVICTVVSLALLCLRLCAKTFKVRDALLGLFIWLAVMISVVLDFYAIAYAYVIHIINNQPLADGSMATTIEWKQLWASTDRSILYISIAMILYLTLSPIAFSCLMHERFRAEDEARPPQKSPK